MAMPKKPKKVAASMNGKRMIRIVVFISTLGTTKLEIAVIATTTTIKFDTRPALTIASPMTSPPTIPIVGPIGAGNRIVASRMTSMIALRSALQ